MQGVETFKTSLLENFDCRIKQIETNGCAKGGVQDEKIHNISENMQYLRKTMSEVNAKLFWGLLMLSIMSFLAGVNTWNELIKVIIR